MTKVMADNSCLRSEIGLKHRHSSRAFTARWTLKSRDLTIWRCLYGSVSKRIEARIEIRERCMIAPCFIYYTTNSRFNTPKSRLRDMVSMWPASLASRDRDFGWCDVSAISVAWYPCVGSKTRRRLSSSAKELERKAFIRSL
jgi:hypothetical protein